MLKKAVLKKNEYGLPIITNYIIFVVLHIDKKLKLFIKFKIKTFNHS